MSQVYSIPSRKNNPHALPDEEIITMSIFTRGSYSTISPMELTGGDLEHPIEGMRDGWAERLVANYWLLKRSKRQQRGFMTALYILANAEVSPPACERSLPIARLQAQLRLVIRRIELGEDETMDDVQKDAADNMND